MEILGQEKILKFISGCSISSIPKTILLVGEQGSGRHSICKIISQKFSLKYKEIEEKITSDLVEGFYFEASPTLCVIDLSKTVIKGENALLKVLEEQPLNCFFVLLCESKELVLPTIINRCYILEMETYSQDILSKFLHVASDRIVLEYAHTPGEVIAWSDIKWGEIQEFSKQVVSAIFAGTPQNLFSTIDSLECSEGSSKKVPLRLFLRVLLKDVCELIKAPGNSRKELYVYQKLNQLTRDILIPNIIKERLIYNTFATIKRELPCK